MPVQVLRRRFTVDEYYRMAEAGILHEDDRVELIEGEIVEMAPIGSRHASCVDRLAQLFFAHLSGRAIIRVQSPIRLGEHSEPQPDITLLLPRADFYSGAHPSAADVLLAVEVADTSVEYDREAKVPLYARSGIRETWLVDLDAGVVEVYQAPSPQGYLQTQRLKPGDHLAPEAFPQVLLPLADILT
jgi:Uma2 family endonuclease